MDKPGNIVSYSQRWTNQETFPKVDKPRNFFPPCFRRLPNQETLFPKVDKLGNIFPSVFQRWTVRGSIISFNFLLGNVFLIIPVWRMITFLSELCWWFTIGNYLAWYLTINMTVSRSTRYVARTQTSPCDFREGNHHAEMSLFQQSGVGRYFNLRRLNLWSSLGKQMKHHWT